MTTSQALLPIFTFLSFKKNEDGMRETMDWYLMFLSPRLALQLSLSAQQQHKLTWAGVGNVTWYISI